uniref:Uncharacterized protein n=1 Tax=Oryza brachyantha TaxID=4533 RepID=J3NBM9_ORYBR
MGVNMLQASMRMSYLSSLFIGHGLLLYYKGTPQRPLFSPPAIVQVIIFLATAAKPCRWSTQRHVTHVRSCLSVGS